MQSLVTLYATAGALTVSDVKTTKVEVVSGAPTTAYDGTAINFKGFGC